MNKDIKYIIAGLGIAVLGSIIGILMIYALIFSSPTMQKLIMLAVMGPYMLVGLVGLCHEIGKLFFGNLYD